MGTTTLKYTAPTLCLRSFTCSTRTTMKFSTSMNTRSCFLTSHQDSSLVFPPTPSLAYLTLTVITRSLLLNSEWALSHSATWTLLALLRTSFPTLTQTPTDLSTLLRLSRCLHPFSGSLMVPRSTSLPCSRSTMILRAPTLKELATKKLSWPSKTSLEKVLKLISPRPAPTELHKLHITY